MKKPALIVIILISALQIAFTAIYGFSSEKHLFKILTDKDYDFKDILTSSKLFCYELIKVFYIVATIMLLTAKDPRRNKIYALIRYVYIIHMLVNIPATIRFYLEVTSIFHDMKWLPFLFNQVFSIAAMVILWRNRPAGEAPSINLSEYSIVTYTSRNHRFIHHIADTAFFLIIGYNFIDRSGLYYNPMPLLLDYLINFIAFFLYYFASEAIFRQTFGKMLTGSCVVSTNSPMNTGKAIGRTFARMIPFDAFSYLFKGDWHDKVSNTTVVYKYSWEDFMFEDERQ